MLFASSLNKKEEISFDFSLIVKAYIVKVVKKDQQIKRKLLFDIVKKKWWKVTPMFFNEQVNKLLEDIVV